MIGSDLRKETFKVVKGKLSNGNEAVLAQKVEEVKRTRRKGGDFARSSHLVGPNE